MCDEFEILPITISQTISIVINKLSNEEIAFIKNSTYNELLEFDVIQELHIDELTGLSQGNRALLEECSYVNSNMDDFVSLVTVNEAIEIIINQLILSLNSQY